MRLKTLVAGGVTMSWMLLAQPALGATVEVGETEWGAPLVLYRAAAGEINTVRVVEEHGRVFVITDSSASVTSEANECVALSANSIRCEVDAGGPFDFFAFLSVFLEDGADGADVKSDYGTVYGGPGPDRLTGALTGDAVDLILYGGSGDDRLVGRSRGEELRGGEGADSLDGGAGDDELVGGAGADVIVGGPGEDEVSFQDKQVAVKITLDGRANDGAVGEHDTVKADVEDVWGSNGPTTFIGDADANRFQGAGKSDVVLAGAGDDTILGSAGRDILSGGTGDDFIDGAAGGDVLLGGPGGDLIYGSAGADVVGGGPGNDVLKAGLDGDHLSGGRGADYLRGAVGNDTLRGGPGRDRLYGNHGADRLYARDGDRDRVIGGRDRDRARVDLVDVLILIEALF
jgi:Ca2+-binding RTX toxin-like protein